MSTQVVDLSARSTDITLVSSSFFGNNITTYPANGEEEEIPLWRNIFSQSQNLITISGFIANVCTFITLTLNGGSFSPLVLSILRHQSMMDAIACLSATILVLQPPMWLPRIPGMPVLDLLVCYAWNAQTIYWAAMTLSIWTLVCLALERYLAVCKPFTHKEFTHSKLYLIMAFIYLLGLFIAVGSALQVRYANGDCLVQFFADGPSVEAFFYGFVIFAFFVFYTIPCTFFFVLYGLVLIALRQRKQSSEMAASRVIDKASSELTKMSIMVTIIFIVTLAFELWNFVLGYTGVVEYKLNSPMQIVSMWLASINSAANPFVYGWLVPAYRKSLIKTFCKCMPPSAPVPPIGNK